MVQSRNDQASRVTAPLSALPFSIQYDRAVSTKTVSELLRLHQEKRLLLRPEYQRNAIWPAAAKSYLVETLIRGLPVPLLFLAPMRSAHSGLPGFEVVDGQQRLVAVFDFVANAYKLSGPDVTMHKGHRYSQLPGKVQGALLDYQFVIEELVGKSRAEVIDIFTRLNKYGVRLRPQELRHARRSGAFKEVVEGVGQWQQWTDLRILTRAAQDKMRSDELAAELLILLIEAGPQDKKDVIDQYYVGYQDDFPDSHALVERLRSYFGWMESALAERPKSRFRKPAELYSLIGALDKVSNQGEQLPSIAIRVAARQLAEFEDELANGTTRRAVSYLVAAGRQTDNLRPRMTRIDALVETLSAALT